MYKTTAYEYSIHMNMILYSCHLFVQSLKYIYDTPSTLMAQYIMYKQITQNPL